MTATPPMLRQQEAVAAVSRWAVGQVAPGWDTLEVHLTARGQRWDVGLLTGRGGAELGRWVVPVEPGSPLEADATAMRESAYRHPMGTWFSAVVTLTPAGWPEPRMRLDTTFNYDDEPTYLLADQPRVGAADLLEDWVRFPRTRGATPAWARERAADAGVSLPFAPQPARPSTDAPPIVPASAADLLPRASAIAPAERIAAVAPSPGSPTSPSAASPAAMPPSSVAPAAASPSPGSPTSASTASPAAMPPSSISPASPSAASPAAVPPSSVAPADAPGRGLTERPAELALLFDRDGIPLSGGRRPQQRRGTVDGRATWRDLLASAGSPLAFVDGTGTWVAVRRAPGGEDVVVGVVTQTTAGGAPDVQVTTDVEPWRLADGDAALTVHYVSVAAPPEEVLAAAREGRVLSPGGRRGTPPDNAPLRAALDEHARRGDGRSLREVLRQAFGGLLVLDATGSRLDASPPQVVVGSVTAPDGTRGLPVFTRNAEVQQYRGDTPEGIFTLVQAAAATLEGAAADPAVRFVVVDPAGAAAVLPADLIRKALADGHNGAVKDLLTTTATREPAGTPSMQALFDALRADEGFLFVAERELDGRVQPVWLDEPDGRTLLVFTSPLEAAAYDDEAPMASGAGYRRLPVGWILEFLVQSRGDALRINPAGPSVDLSVAQVRHLLANPVTD
ncbi:SseB family protein [Georgenia daeguensis]|uniref:SseB protein N-terminal domain-containing protein n=1 Tax=Georgenia daeguensis TaxID=908355 RepID=A0ABP8ESP3_9MICO